MSTKEIPSAESVVKATENKVVETKRRLRISDIRESGPLAFFMEAKIPGYRIRIQDEGSTKDRFLIQKYLQRGYEFVTPKEIEYRDINGEVMPGDKIEIKTNRGVAYVLKIREEYALEDDEDKKRINRKILNTDPTPSTGIDGVHSESSSITAEKK